LTENSSEEEIRAIVSHEYESEYYETISKEIMDMWGKASQGLEDLRCVSDFHLHDEYEISLTRYGVGGSYSVDTGRVIVNVRKRDGERTVSVVKHEIVHMGIEHLIQEYNVSHWKKERLVDLICEKYFGMPTQDIKEEVSDVDESFTQLWPDVREIIQKIGK
jgi:hypothetical protein